VCEVGQCEHRDGCEQKRLHADDPCPGCLPVAAVSRVAPRP
jgi:hypothetical protein